MNQASPTRPASVDNGQVEVMVRRSPARLARRYAPIGVALCAVVLMLTLVPTVGQRSQHVSAAGSGDSGSTTGTGSGAGTATTAVSQGSVAAGSAGGGTA